jgi:hypothetical protein
MVCERTTLTDSDERLSELLSAPNVWAETPDALDELLDRAVGSNARRPLRRMAILAAAAVVATLVFIGVSQIRSPDPVDFVLSGTERAPQAHADVRIVETPAGLDPAPPGMYYQGWVVAGDEAVSVGSFHMRGGDGRVSLWSGVDPDTYRVLLVTLQSVEEGPQLSSEIVLRGEG